MIWRWPTPSLTPQLDLASDQRSAVASVMPFRARTTRRRMWKSPPVRSTDNTSPTKTIGEEAKAWHGDRLPAQLQAAAGRGPAARNAAASTNARRQDDGRICLLNDGPAKSCTRHSDACVIAQSTSRGTTPAPSVEPRRSCDRPRRLSRWRCSAGTRRVNARRPRTRASRVPFNRARRRAWQVRARCARSGARPGQCTIGSSSRWDSPPRAPLPARARSSRPRCLR